MAIFGPRVGHDALFDEVCRFAAVDRKTKMLLQSVIKKYQMPQPARIFIEPDAIMRALSDPEFAEENDDLQKLYNDWFTEQATGARRR
jgi:hypothetical protein